MAVYDRLGRPAVPVALERAAQARDRVHLEQLRRLELADQARNEVEVEGAEREDVGGGHLLQLTEPSIRSHRKRSWAVSRMKRSVFVFFRMKLARSPSREGTSTSSKDSASTRRGAS